MKFFKLIFITLLIFFSTIPANATQEMDILDFLPAILAASRSNNQTPQDYYHLFILSGQSNMNRMDIGFFLPIVEDEFGPDHVIAVKDAEDGQSITQWYDLYDIEKDGEVVGWLYDRLMNNVFAAIEGKYIESVTFVWMQGEYDATHEDIYTVNYEDNLLGLIDLIESDLATNINFVIGRLNGYGLPLKNWNTIRAIQVEVADGDPNGSWVNTDDIPRDGGSVHFSHAGYEILGSRFALAAISLINPN